MENSKNCVIVDAMPDMLSGFVAGCSVTGLMTSDKAIKEMACLNINLKKNGFGAKFFVFKTQRKCGVNLHIDIVDGDETKGSAVFLRRSALEGLKSKETTDGWLVWSNR